MSTGKTIALGCGVVLLLGVLGIASCAGLLYMGFQGADAAAAPVVDALIAAAVDGSFPETYDTMTTPEFRQAVSPEEYSEIGQLIATRLGPLKSKSITSYNMSQVNADSFITAEYNAQFEKGAGTIELKLKKVAGEWKLLNFEVQSPQLIGEPESDAESATPSDDTAPTTEEAEPAA